MGRSTFTIVLYLLLVFTSGILVGAFGHRLATVPPVAAKAPTKPSPEEWRKHYLGEMQTRLKLTPEQYGQVNSILDETRSRFHEARANHDVTMKTIREEQTNKVRSILTDTQRPEYEKLHAEREARAKANAK